MRVMQAAAPIAAKLMGARGLNRALMSLGPSRLSRRGPAACPYMLGHARCARPSRRACTQQAQAPDTRASPSHAWKKAGRETRRRTSFGCVLRLSAPYPASTPGAAAAAV
jgi:hypothetical protein